MINGSFEFELDIGNIIKAFSILELEVLFFKTKDKTKKYLIIIIG